MIFHAIGSIHKEVAKEDIVTTTNGGKVYECILETDNGTKFLPIPFWGDKINELQGLKKGDRVQVSFYINAKPKDGGGFFINLNAVGVKKMPELDPANPTTKLV